MDIKSVLDKIAESLAGDITIEPDWLSEHVGVLPEDRVTIDPGVWAQMAGFIERREAIRSEYQTLAGRVSEYELNPYHLLAYDGNWYVLARNLSGSGLVRDIAPSHAGLSPDSCFRPDASYIPEKDLAVC